MFDNPEKLFILFVIALMILGPSKLASLGASLGRSIRDFRGAVRGAHDEFRSAVQEHVDGLQEHVNAVQDEVKSLAPALPAPHPLYDAAAAMPVDYGAATAETSDLSASPGAPVPSTAAAGAAAAFVQPDAGSTDADLSSLASEPTVEELRKAAAR